MKCNKKQQQQQQQQQQSVTTTTTTMTTLLISGQRLLHNPNESKSLLVYNLLWSSKVFPEKNCDAKVGDSDLIKRTLGPAQWYVSENRIPPLMGSMLSGCQVIKRCINMMKYVQMQKHVILVSGELLRLFVVKCSPFELGDSLVHENSNYPKLSKST